jgi:hypothetical protein
MPIQSLFRLIFLIGVGVEKSVVKATFSLIDEKGMEELVECRSCYNRLSTRVSFSCFALLPVCKGMSRPRYGMQSTTTCSPFETFIRVRVIDFEEPIVVGPDQMIHFQIYVSQGIPDVEESDFNFLSFVANNHWPVVIALPL